VFSVCRQSIGINGELVWLPSSHVYAVVKSTLGFAGSARVVEADSVRSLPKRDLPLGIVLDACPDIGEITQDQTIRHWRDLLAAAETIRPMLGVSPSAWAAEACAILGEQQAAITLAAIYQRADQISSPGGYLRSLTDRAKDGKFSTWPMIMALLRAKLEQNKLAKGEGNDSDHPKPTQMEVSSALLRTLQNRKP